MLSRSLLCTARLPVATVHRRRRPFAYCGVLAPPKCVAPRHASSSAASARAEALAERNKKVAMYATAIVVGVLGASYAAVPLYRIFCQVTGFGGTTQVADAEKAAKMMPVEGGRLITVRFDANVASTMPWQFVPAQLDVRVVPGETALAFYTARNTSDQNITGVATYNVSPLRAGLYFNKIQCFCFEEQRLRAGEEVDMPVFFFLDPDLLEDPAMDDVHNITLGYTFFKTGQDGGVDFGEEEEDEEDSEEHKEELKERGRSK